MADWDFTTPDLGSALLGQVFALGESNKELLGVLPYAAWDEYAADGRIVAAVTQAGDLAGYCAFRLPRNEVILTHLVVSPEWRGTGIAQALVLELSARYRDRRGLRAKCRRDYEAHSAWPRLGFVPVGDRPGRGRDGTPLTMWWRDHGHADLLSWQGSTASVTSVVMDANVFFDLNPTDPAQPVAQSVQWLEQIQDRIELLVAPELLVEVDRQKDPQRRASLKSAANAYPRLVVDPDRFDVAVVVLRASGRPTVSRQDESDLRHVAYAAAAGVQVVVTRDGEAMRKYADLARGELGVRVLEPRELVTHLDELEQSEAYWPSALLGTGYTVREMTADDDWVVDSFHDHSSGEQKHRFRGRLRDLAGRKPSATRRVYEAPDRSPVALVGAAPEEGSLRVPVLRVKPGALQATLAQHVVAGLRALALATAAEAVVVSEPELHPLVVDALRRDAYRLTVGGWVAPTLDRLVPMSVAAETVRAVVARFELADEELPHEPGTPDWCRALETIARPMRISDAPIDNLLVPIKPPHASQLFGYPPQLFERRGDLGMSVEHVYFTGARSGERVPSRVLWYLSGPHSRFVFASSDLVEVVDDEPRMLFARFRRLGVYTLRDVEGAARKADGRTRALRVTNTEVFHAPIPLVRLREICASHGHSLSLVSPSKVPSGVFVDVMQEGRNEWR